MPSSALFTFVLFFSCYDLIPKITRKCPSFRQCAPPCVYVCVCVCRVISWLSLCGCEMDGGCYTWRCREYRDFCMSQRILCLYAYAQSPGVSMMRLSSLQVRTRLSVASLNSSVSATPPHRGSLCGQECPMVIARAALVSQRNVDFLQ